MKISGCHIWDSGKRKYSLQLHNPRLLWHDRDLNVSFPTVFRFIWNARPTFNVDKTDNKEFIYREYGIGLIVLGFGFAFLYKRLVYYP